MSAVAFLPILEDLKRQHIYLNPDEIDVKGCSPPLPPVEDQAIRAVNEALHQASRLNEDEEDLSGAARIIEKIQVAVAIAERAAFIAHSERARRSFRLAQQIADKARQLFHEMKLKKRPTVKAA